MTKLALKPLNSTDAQPTRQRETIVVAGEFEVGKSSVVNALLRRNLLPNDPGFLSRPLVRICHHHTTIINAKLSDGSQIEADSIDDLVERDDVVVCTIYTPLPGMEAVEIIEIPFDPTHGFDAEHHAIMRTANLFIWGTIASQAWRLSEKTIIQGLQEDMRERSVLAITRADKLISSNDLDLIERRLQKEAAPFFSELVFMQASTKNLVASETTEAGWRETGGYTLFEVASDVINELSVDKDVLLDIMDGVHSDGPSQSIDNMDSNEAEAILAEHELDSEFRVAEQTSENTLFVKSIPGQQSTTDAGSISEAPVNDAELSLTEIVEDCVPEESELPQQVKVDIETVVEAEVPSNESIVESDPEQDGPLEQIQTESEPGVELVAPEPEPESEAQKIASAVNNIAGLKTAGVANAKTLEVFVSFQEDTITAEQCVEAFSTMIETDAEAMVQLQTEDSIREMIFSVSGHLILLQMFDDDSDKFAFFILQSDQTNPGIASMTTKRLVSIWRGLVAKS